MTESPVGAVDKALLTLTALAQVGPSGATLADLATRLDLHKPTLHRTLAALRHRGFVDQLPNAGYTLGSAAIALADGFDGDEHLPSLLHPALARMCEELSELVHLGTLSGRQIVYLDKVEPERPIRVWSQIGARRVAASTALGRAWLSRMDLTPRALSWYADGALTPARLSQVLDEARTHGWAGEVEETEVGIACVAVALVRAGVPIAAISVTVPVERADAARREAIGAELLERLPVMLPAGLAVGQPYR